MATVYKVEYKTGDFYTPTKGPDRPNKSNLQTTGRVYKVRPTIDHMAYNNKNKIKDKNGKKMKKSDFKKNDWTIVEYTV